MLIRCPSPLQITVGRPRPDIVARCVPPLDYTSNPCSGSQAGRSVPGPTSFKKGSGVSRPVTVVSVGRECGTWPCLLLAVSRAEWFARWNRQRAILTRFWSHTIIEMRIWDRRGYTLKSWLLLIPVSAAALISISRTMDYRHHAT
jgi:diacylglycerol diphosphate phosphatase/phosphatidate phosphatase